MNSCPSRSATIGTNNCPGRSVRVSKDAPSNATSGPSNRPPIARAASDANNLTSSNGTVLAVTEQPIHLVVLFGGESAEHDVSCTTAAHVLRAADPARYRITPVGIARDGQWAVAAEAAALLERGPEHLPGRLDPAGQPISPTPMLERVAGETDTSRTVVLPLLHGPMGEDGTVQGLLELAGVPYVDVGLRGVSRILAVAKGELEPRMLERAAELKKTEMPKSKRRSRKKTT